MAKVDPYSLNLPCRYMTLSPKDEADLTDLLVAAFPDLRFLERPHRSPIGQEQPPPLPLLRSFDECKAQYVELIFDPLWEPLWEWSDRWNEWDLTDMSVPNATWERSSGIKQSPERPGLEYIVGGRFYFRVVKGDKAQAALARKALRLVTKVASNKHLMQVRYPSLEFRYRMPDKGGMDWFGHDARRWCRESLDRILFDGTGSASRRLGYRPTD